MELKLYCREKYESTLRSYVTKSSTMWRPSRAAPVFRSSSDTQQLQRFSFLCGNMTMFNQLTLTCSRPEDSVPCRNAPVFYYVNDNIGYQDTPFLYDDDVSNADQFIHTNRLQNARPKRPF